MTVDKGYRFGTKPHQNFGAGWKYVLGQHPDYQKIRADPKLSSIVEARLRKIIRAQERALAMTRYLLLACFGGHASAQLIEHGRGIIKESSSPADNLNRIRSSLPAEEFDL